MGTRHVMVIFPESPDNAAVEDFRSRWDPLAASVAAHITLVYPFETDASSHALEGVATQVANRHAAFAVELVDPTVWDDEYLFLLAHTGGAQIRRLHLDLYAALPDAHATSSFVPHVTIGRHRERREVERALLAARRRNLHLRGCARSLSAYRIGQDGQRRILFTVPLQQRGVGRT